MGTRSDERTESSPRPSDSTDELLAETERLLSGPDTDENGSTPRESTTPSAETDSTTSSRLPSMPSSGSLRQYFSPKAFVALVVLVGLGLFVGGLAIPLAGRTIGMFGVAFAVGLLASRRRYLELTTAGAVVGSAAALSDYAVLAVAGSGRAVLTVGIALGVVACLGGYYFGRDLRNGLFRDIE